MGATVDLAGLTVPVFAAVFGMGWASCYTVLVRPMQARLEDLEKRLLAVETAKDERIASLEERLNLLTAPHL